MDLTTKYMGFELKSPLIAGSSGLTRSLENIIEFEKQGVGAVVLKSLFEEQIQHEIDKAYNEASGDSYPEAMDYIRSYSEEKSLSDYLSLIEKAKKKCSIPIIASINCNTASEWISFASRIESAGADALELNIFILPSDPGKEGSDNEEMYFKIYREVKKQISIPIAIKLGNYFSGLARFATRLSWEGPSSLVLFNRFFGMDINLEKMQYSLASAFSTEEDLHQSLRWIAILSDRIYCDIAASGGVHNAEGLIKQLLAGANAVQVTSAFYRQGPAFAAQLLSGLTLWMEKNGYDSINDFRGLMSVKKTENPAALERVQFMKYFSGLE
jgi:dihydroorotate dehydrogenase (fumarate)